MAGGAASSIPAPRPVTARPAAITSMLGAAAPITAPAAYSETPATSARSGPARAISQPDTGRPAQSVMA